MQILVTLMQAWHRGLNIFLYGGQPGSRFLPMENGTRPMFTKNKVSECQATNQSVAVGHIVFELAVEIKIYSLR